MVVHQDGTRQTHNNDGSLEIESPGYLPVSIGCSAMRVSVRTRNEITLTCSNYGQFEVLSNGVSCFQVQRDGRAHCGSMVSGTHPVTLHADGDAVCTCYVAGKPVLIDVAGTLLDDDMEDIAEPLQLTKSPVTTGSARFFIIRKNGDGEEVLMDTALPSEPMDDATPKVLLQKSDSLDLYGEVITVTQPVSIGSSSQWLPSVQLPSKKFNSNIDVVLSHTPRQGKQKRFARSYGKGLTVGVQRDTSMAKSRGNQSQEALLSVVQYLKLPEITDEVRTAFTDGLNSFQHLDNADRQPFANDRRVRPTEGYRVTSANHQFLQWLFAQHLQGPTSCQKVRMDYGQFIESTSSLHSVTDRPASKNIAAYRDSWQADAAEAEENRENLRNKVVPGYFDSLIGQQALATLHGAGKSRPSPPDMALLTSKLATATINITKIPEIRMESAQSVSNSSVPPLSRMSEAELPELNGFGTPLVASAATFQTLGDDSRRPTNPTPHAASSTTDSGSAIGAVDSNSTDGMVAHGTTISEDQTRAETVLETQEVLGQREPGATSVQPTSRSIMRKDNAPASKFINTAGDFRTTAVPTPKVLHGTRDGAARNEEVSQAVEGSNNAFLFKIYKYGNMGILQI